ncbi:VolA/Pla-1 family phospholipase [Thalassotalea crassostreae]|uniref:VolA/Pla-1 family phospholipase n=1 Tax=Thalassotalea crassostreae TaxID=1763536 RepID=UPI000838A111|nr:VolA/Pla-1 family phospholipase [Thalassotalea crassostreae]
MNKLLVSLAVTATLGLTACDDETIADVQAENNKAGTQSTAPLSASRVTFDPSNGLLSYPNDLLFSPTTANTADFTLNLPVDDPTDLSDPLVAANALDGWSTNQPFVIGFDFADGVSLDPSAVYNSNAVSVYEVVMGANLEDPDCAEINPSLVCKTVRQLNITEDYFIQALGDDLAFVPLKPLKPKTTYIVALTDRLEDTNGNQIYPSTTYDLMQNDINASPLADPAQRGLQAIINSYENVAEEFGIQRESIIYTMAMTTQSTTDVLDVAKKLIVSDLADPSTAPYTGVQYIGQSAADLLGFEIVDETDPRVIYTAAKVHVGSVNNVRYYSAVPTEANPAAPVNTPWKANCDSGAMLAGADPAMIPEGPISANDGFCMAFGLRDIGIDTDRNLTKFNPIPALVERQNLDVLMTTPDINEVNKIRGKQGMPLLEVPENGWPVVMYQHGITRSKEDMLAITGALSMAGFATAAIDHPLHGSRGYGPMNAVVDPVAYLNLGSLLTGLSNMRQSITDTLAFRMALNTVMGVDEGINGNEVYYTGQSLGSITGVAFLAMTNTTVGDSIPGVPAIAIDPKFKVDAATLSVPGGGIGNFLMESPSFGPLIKGLLAASGSEDFRNFAVASGFGDDYTAAWVAFEEAGMASAFDGSFALFTFATQSILDSADPINFAGTVQSNGSNILVHTVVGNGMDNLEDQIIPSKADGQGNQLAGSNALISLLGLPVISTYVEDENGVSAAVKFVNGNHGSLLDPSPQPESINEAAVTQEMQTQMANYFMYKGTKIEVNDADLVLK